MLLYATLRENGASLRVQAYCEQTGQHLFPPFRQFTRILLYCDGMQIDDAEE